MHRSFKLLLISFLGGFTSLALALDGNSVRVVPQYDISQSGAAFPMTAPGATDQNTGANQMLSMVSGGPLITVMPIGFSTQGVRITGQKVTLPNAISQGSVGTGVPQKALLTISNLTCSNGVESTADGSALSGMTVGSGQDIIFISSTNTSVTQKAGDMTYENWTYASGLNVTGGGVGIYPSTGDTVKAWFAISYWDDIQGRSIAVVSDPVTCVTP